MQRHCLVEPPLSGVRHCRLGPGDQSRHIDVVLHGYLNKKKEQILFGLSVFKKF